MTTIRWINHAGYELHIDGVTIVHDPWLEGLAFGDGWALLSETNYPIERFNDVDYIWFSHEHPDHFSPASLKKIPEQVRKGITILFQETRDKRVKLYCEKLGFAVKELPQELSVALSETVSIRCGAVLGRDSWLYVKGRDHSFFNSNDCVGVDWGRIKALIGEPIDLLLSQFSYANWVGNPGEDARMKAAALEKFAELDNQIAVFQPSTLIPFASYVWFCRDDNFHMNKNVNTISDVEQRYGDRIETVVLYPGDVYEVGGAWDSTASISRYEQDRLRHTRPIEVQEQPVAIEALIGLADAEHRKLSANNALWLLQPLRWGGYVPPVRIFLRDLAEGVQYSMFRGIERRSVSRDTCDIECSSASFAAMMRNGYGFGTLAVNGRYIELRANGMNRVSKNFALSARNEEGETVPGIFFDKDYVLAHLPKPLRKMVRA